MPYNFVTDTVHIKKLSSKLSSSEMQFHKDNGHFAFELPFGGLRATYDDNLRLIGDFLLVLIELFH